MREANEDLKVVSKQPEWRAPIITQFAAEDAEGGALHAVPDSALPSTS